jgi:hypothetical protein
MGKFPEMQDSENVEKARIKTAAFIEKRLSDIEGAEWSKFLTRQITDSCKRGIPLENVNAASTRIAGLSTAHRLCGSEAQSFCLR